MCRYRPLRPLRRRRRSALASPGARFLFLHDTRPAMVAWLNVTYVWCRPPTGSLRWLHGLLAGKSSRRRERGFEDFGFSPLIHSSIQRARRAPEASHASCSNPAILRPARMRFSAVDVVCAGDEARSAFMGSIAAESENITSLHSRQAPSCLLLVWVNVSSSALGLGPPGPRSRQRDS